MPDYVAILKRSIASLPDDGPDMRQAVYDRARSALARQLTAVEPPLPPEDIEGHHAALEDAIAVVEEDFAAASAGVEEPDEEPAPPPPTDPLPRR
ncbi:hypothetical protein CKO34_16245, partial [Afifella marina]|nr:hypothetical protein [Afifella marina]